MSIAAEIDDLELAMRNVLLTTRATAVCPFHQEVTIRIGDDAAETMPSTAHGISSRATV